eukprot:77690_1
MCKWQNQFIMFLVLGMIILWNVYIGNDNINYNNVSNNINYINVSNRTIDINSTKHILNRPKYKYYNMIILKWQTIFGANENISLTMNCNISTTDKILINQKILVTSNKSLRSFANALVIHGPDIKTMKTLKAIHKKQDDIYILSTQESPSNSNVWHEKVLSYFNILMSYKLTADISIPYLSLNSFKTFIFKNNIHSFKEKDTTADVLWIGSNCMAYNGREKYLAELFKYIDIHSLGSCLHLNPSNVTIPSRSNYFFDISNIVSKYKFYIAFENSNCEGYITEKLLKSLQAT